jgi:hypothetical protein
MSRLIVIVDGTPMPDGEARAFWKRFSAHMDAHKGDLAGFAKAEGFASVHPVMGPDGAELHASRNAPQQAYANAPRRSGSGSPDVHVSDKKRRESN